MLGKTAVRGVFRKINLDVAWSVANLAGNRQGGGQNGGVTQESPSIVRLKDIARKLNISVSTVSRALGKHTCNMVAPELRKEILELAEQTNYVPDRAAQLMRKPRVHLITVLLPQETDVFMSEYNGVVLSGVISAARDGGIETRVALIDPDGGDILEQMQQVSIGAGGLLYMALPLTVRQLVKLEDFVRPVVVMGGSLPPDVDVTTSRVNTVVVDNFAATHELTTRLLQLGHRRIGLIGGPTTGRDAWERERGFRDAMKHGRGLLDPQAIIHVEFSVAAGWQGWQQIGRCVPRPTAVVCGDDEIAFGVLQALAKEKINCPAEVSVVGFDDSRWAARVTPPLTTARQPMAQLGRTAAELLMNRLRNTGETEAQHRLFPAEIIDRQSVAAPAHS
jgi:DNA-binding LacI/PurR family transcriptional regulator